MADGNSNVKGFRQEFSGAMLTRAAELSVEDKDQRRVRVAMSSETPVIRGAWDWASDTFKRWNEVLSHEPGAADFSRIDAGAAPLMKDHAMWSSDSQLGTVERAWIGEDRRGYADVRFSKRDDVTPFFNDVVDGIRRSVSVTYEVLERVLTTAGTATALPTYTVTRWRVLELSFTPVPADPNTGTMRSLGEGAEGVASNPVVLRSFNPSEDSPMPDPTVPNAAPTPAADDAASRSAAAAAAAAPDAAAIAADTAKRAAAVSALCMRHKMDEAFTTDVITRGLTVEQVSHEILSRAATPAAAPPAVGNGTGAAPAPDAHETIARSWDTAIASVSRGYVKPAAA